MPAARQPIAGIFLAGIVAVGCGSDTTVVPSTGSIEVRLQVTGASPDPNGCIVTVDDIHERHLTGGERITIDGLSEGLHVAVLSDVASHCSLQGDSVRSVVVGLDQPATLDFVVDCPAPSGIEVTNRTAGSGGRPSGYAVEVDWTQLQEVELGDTAVFSNLAPGEHTVKLNTGASECAVVGENPRTVFTAEGETVAIDFGVACPPFFDYIAFESSRDGWGLFVMKPDGSELLNLTPDTIRHSAYPAWHPDATRVSFTIDGNVWVLNTATMLSTRLTVGGDVQLNAWSPDGTWIAYDSFTGEVQGESWGDIYVIRADGTNPVNLTPGAARGAEPAWSPDGSQIAFTGEVDGVWEVFVMQADGSNPVRLTDLRAAMPNSRYWPTAYEPAWSPDGTRIAFSATGEQADNTIWLMNADGSDLTQLTDDLPAYQAWRPSWSPDGSRIAYWAYRPDDGLCYQIYAMEADGSNPTNITNHDSCNENPAWSPAE